MSTIGPSAIPTVNVNNRSSNKGGEQGNGSKGKGRSLLGSRRGCRECWKELTTLEVLVWDKVWHDLGTWGMLKVQYVAGSVVEDRGRGGYWVLQLC